jgi:hypothetical protein
MTRAWVVILRKVISVQAGRHQAGRGSRRLGPA